MHLIKASQLYAANASWAVKHKNIVPSSLAQIIGQGMLNTGVPLGFRDTPTLFHHSFTLIYTVDYPIVPRFVMFYVLKKAFILLFLICCVFNGTEAGLGKAVGGVAAAINKNKENIKWAIVGNAAYDALKGGGKAVVRAGRLFVEKDGKLFKVNEDALKKAFFEAFA